VSLNFTDGLAPVAGRADDPRMRLAPIVWIGGAVALAAGVVFLFFRGSSSKDLGAVSDQWVAQHRAGQVDDLNR
jgi:hypothetical protein